MSKKRWIVLLLSSVVLGGALLVFLPTLPATHGAPSAEASEAPPECDLEAGYCPRRPRN